MSDTSPLTLVLPGALPPAPLAADLAKQLTQPNSPAPTFLRWMQQGEAKVVKHAADDTGATVIEGWWLSHAGYVAPAPLTLGAGLAPLLAPDAAPDTPVWIAELVHIQVGRDGLVLTDPASLRISAEESHALLESVAPLMAGDGVTATAINPRRWRVALAPGVLPLAATTCAVVGKPLESWWPKSLAARPWRRLANEIQMSWHDHPVNEARIAAGEPPINGVWLHGGAVPWSASWPQGKPRQIIGDAPWLQALAERETIAWAGTSMPASQLRGAAVVTLDQLDAPNRAQAWGDWLAALAELERQWFAPLATALAKETLTQIDLILPDAARTVSLTLKRRAPWLRWLPSPRQNWNSWWHPES